MRKIFNCNTGLEIDAEDSGEVLPLEVIENQIKAATLAELNALDLASIRAMREYIASKADAPQILKDRETAARAARAKLK